MTCKTVNPFANSQQPKATKKEEAKAETKKTITGNVLDIEVVSDTVELEEPIMEEPLIEIMSEEEYNQPVKKKATRKKKRNE